MNQAQHGFRYKRSTIGQLLRYYDFILSMLEEGHVVDSIYLDFSNAFERIDHNILLLKMKSNWKSTTMDQKLSKKTSIQQAVRTNGQLSKTEWVISGVLQGSVLGPLLFLIMMLGIDEEILTAMLCQMIKADLGINILQQQLQHMYSWTERNNMHFNMHFNSGEFEHMR